MSDRLVAYTERPDAVFRLFTGLREDMDDPERVTISVEGTEITFRPIEDAEEGLNIAPSTGDVSAAGVVSEHDLSIEEGRYEAVSVADNTWAINFGEGAPDPVGGRDSFVDQLRDALAEDTLGTTFTVDEIRVNRTEIDDVDLLEDLIAAEGRKSAVEAYEKQLADLSDENDE